VGSLHVFHAPVGDIPHGAAGAFIDGSVLHGSNWQQPNQTKANLSLSESGTSQSLFTGLLNPRFDSEFCHHSQNVGLAAEWQQNAAADHKKGEAA
jgi:hypothetical protein